MEARWKRRYERSVLAVEYTYALECEPDLQVHTLDEQCSFHSHRHRIVLLPGMNSCSMLHQPKWTAEVCKSTPHHGTKQFLILFFSTSLPWQDTKEATSLALESSREKRFQLSLST